jgi:topoisomerase IA-like protein
MESTNLQFRAEEDGNVYTVRIGRFGPYFTISQDGGRDIFYPIPSDCDIDAVDLAYLKGIVQARSIKSKTPDISV